MNEDTEDSSLVHIEGGSGLELDPLQISNLARWVREANDPYLRLPIIFRMTADNYLYATGGLDYYLLALPHSPHLMLFERCLLGYRRCQCSCGVVATNLACGGYTFADQLHIEMYRKLRLEAYREMQVPRWLEQELLGLDEPLANRLDISSSDVTMP